MRSDAPVRHLRRIRVARLGENETARSMAGHDAIKVAVQGKIEGSEKVQGTKLGGLLRGRKILGFRHRPGEQDLAVQLADLPGGVDDGASPGECFESAARRRHRRQLQAKCRQLCGDSAPGG